MKQTQYTIQIKSVDCLAVCHPLTDETEEDFNKRFAESNGKYFFRAIMRDEFGVKTKDHLTITAQHSAFESPAFNEDDPEAKSKMLVAILDVCGKQIALREEEKSK